jgi:hypothetical protein
MGCALVVDTNVFLLVSRDVNCTKVLQRVRLLWDDMLLLDQDHRIEQEYKRLAQQQPDSPLRGLVKLLLDQAGAATTPETSAVFLHIPSRLAPEEYAFPDCCNTAEPALFGVARDQPQTYLVIPGERHVGAEPIKRCYRNNGNLQNLLRQLKLQILTTENIDPLFEPGDPAPRTREQLEAFLVEHRLDATTPERSFLECKCPGVIEDGITRSLVDDIMKAVCAFANQHPGYIFVGVQDSGAICGLPLKYHRAERASWDHVWRDVAGSMQHFRPEQPIITPWWIPVDNSKMVLAIRVDRHRIRNFTYRGHRYERIGTSSPRRDRAFL